ncbi:MAG: ribonuclease HII [Treponema sp.]|nr:MAG: ribonuclease HII [Treponema sp.]
MICGIDEAGRGPLAGPVCAAAVILPINFDISILNDSKKMSEKKRQIAKEVICKESIWGIGWSEADEIDKINILQATLKAMKRAYDDMIKKLNNAESNILEPVVIVDGNKTPEIPNAKAIVKADSQYPQVMAASILAKTFRDELMCEYASKFPNYGYEKHKGYPTKAHKKAILEFGESPIQRKTFKY